MTLCVYGDRYLVQRWTITS